ncbi:MAG: phosphoribosylanthranilate isomerase [Desulfurivibrionaceae bacterium]|nr:phosphoribosylanthranilate isomerase [Desulfobulbales bacterium]MDT8334728.1 phosphoribosylanthranilate isomerase [Desulfurivibrionaceae bacterium]
MVNRTRIKVCGITDPDDLAHAVSAGVDGVGFIFAEKSPRRIEPEKARELIRAVPPFVDAVGVFVNEDPDVVTDIIKYCGLTMVQLHGQENIDYCRLMPVRVLKSFAVKNGADGSEMAAYAGVAAGYLLDTYDQGMAGGTGRAFDWNLIKGLRIPGPVLLAGGLGPENVGEAISVARPFAVDVNSGVEKSPGRKDHALLTALIEAVRRADLELP